MKTSEQIITLDDGSIGYFFDGKFHNEYGPAIISNRGDTKWFFHGQRHRISGPAVEWADGTKEWWIYDTNYTEEQYNNYMLIHNFNHI